MKFYQEFSLLLNLFPNTLYSLQLRSSQQMQNKEQHFI
jgi:hypothetical protein